MAAACVEALPLYRPRDPQASDLWRLLNQHFENFRQVYDERFAAQYGFWRPVVERSVAAFLKCGDLHQGFARVRCLDCTTPCSWPSPANSAAHAFATRTHFLQPQNHCVCQELVARGTRRKTTDFGTRPLRLLVEAEWVTVRWPRSGATSS
jgi:hypothetical protein